MLRRSAPLLLVAGAVLLAAVLVWPTQHLVSRGAGGTRHLVDIWFTGQVRGVTESVFASTDSSTGLVALVAAAVVLLIAAAMLWVSAVTRGAAAGSAGVARGAAVTAAVLAAAATTLLCVALARGGSVAFGWMATVDVGALENEQTPVALFVPLAAVLGAVAVVAMLTLVARRGVPT